MDDTCVLSAVFRSSSSRSRISMRESISSSSRVRAGVADVHQTAATRTKPAISGDIDFIVPTAGVCVELRRSPATRCKTIDQVVFCVSEFRNKACVYLQGRRPDRLDVIVWSLKVSTVCERARNVAHWVQFIYYRACVLLCGTLLTIIKLLRVSECRLKLSSGNRSRTETAPG